MGLLWTQTRNVFDNRTRWGLRCSNLTLRKLSFFQCALWLLWTQCSNVLVWKFGMQQPWFQNFRKLSFLQSVTWLLWAQTRNVFWQCRLQCGDWRFGMQQPWVWKISLKWRYSNTPFFHSFPSLGLKCRNGIDFRPCGLTERMPSLCNTAILPKFWLVPNLSKTVVPTVSYVTAVNTFNPVRNFFDNGGSSMAIEQHLGCNN